MDEKTAAVLWNSFWIALAIGLWLFHRRLSFAERRKWHPHLNIGVGILFIVTTVAFSFLTNTKWSSPWLPVITFMVACVCVAGIVTLNIKMTKFCESCESAVVNNNWFQAFNFCPKCGAKFK